MAVINRMRMDQRTKDYIARRSTAVESVALGFAGRGGQWCDAAEHGEGGFAG